MNVCQVIGTAHLRFVTALNVNVNIKCFKLLNFDCVNATQLCLLLTPMQGRRSRKG